MRYYIVPQRIQQKKVNFTEEQMHHMRKVLRLPLGSIVECFDEKGNVYNVEIKKLARDGSYGVILSTETHDLINKKFITIMQAFPSALPKLDLVVEKCTELGADNFVFFKSKRSELFVLPSEDKIERWKKIIIKASEQSQRFNVPQIHVIKDVNEIDYTPYDLKIVLYEKSDNLKLTDNFNQYKNIIVAIGPEGGWESREIDEFKLLGFQESKPFQNILRTETAPIAITSILSQN